jgi:hypothetical protein
MARRTRLIVAVGLIVQAVSFFAMFIILCAKKKSISAAFLAVATLEGAAGAYLLWQVKREEEDEVFGNFMDDDDDFMDDIDLDESMLNADLNSEDDFSDISVADIPKDEDASEEEFN